jgi:nitroimidazol reductase NimA-like FMN-containing flavoprotein (pyridoxamine 5'-phosphate oxidase superfamily)
MASNTFHVRRKDKEITDPEAVKAIIREAKFCHLAFIDGDEPYIVPVNFGYDGEYIYFHSALKGRKVDIFSRNSRVCFNMVAGFEAVDLSPKACKVRYRSVTGTGTIRIIDDREEKIHGLKAIMLQNLGHEYEFQLEKLDTTLVVRIDITELQGKKSG